MNLTRFFPWLKSEKWKSRPPSISTTDVQCLFILCFTSSCSKKRNVLLWSTFYLTCTCVFHLWGVYSFLQASHYRFSTLYSTMVAFYSIVLFMTSFCTISLILILLECGSVQMNWASSILRPDLFRHLICLRQKLIISFDSLSMWHQGGLLYLLHSLQWLTSISSGMFSVISILFLRQLMHIFVWLGTIITPHRQHLISWA